MLKTPKKAHTIVRALRKHVKKPGVTTAVLTPTGIRWERKKWKYLNLPMNACCPMGMLPNAKTPSPIHTTDFACVHYYRNGKMENEKYPYSKTAIHSFYIWFDKQKDIKATVKAIWEDEL